MTISIITCTYNPDDTLLKRLLKAVEEQIIPSNIAVEYIIVDNNSPNPVSERVYVQDFLKNVAWAKLIVETEQGLTAARIAGYLAAKGDWLVFFDDDNEPTSDYIAEVAAFTNNYPDIAVFGPGVVQVEFVGKPERIVAERYKRYFQDKSVPTVMFSDSPYTHTYYPYGTGQVVMRLSMQEYLLFRKNNNLQTTDRKGTSLASAGDTQIIWLAIKNGRKVAITPTLSLKHLINEKKATFDYLKRVIYGTSVSYLPAFVEIFPDIITQIPPKTTSAINFQLIKSYIKLILKGFAPDSTLNFIRLLANFAGEAKVYGRPNTKLLNFFLEKFKMS
jgi:glycosyltransferase involved in cell wall biosynthesis